MQGDRTIKEFAVSDKKPYLDIPIPIEVTMALPVEEAFDAPTSERYYLFGEGIDVNEPTLVYRKKKPIPSTNIQLIDYLLFKLEELYADFKKVAREQQVGDQYSTMYSWHCQAVASNYNSLNASLGACKTEAQKVLTAIEQQYL